MKTVQSISYSEVHELAHGKHFLWSLTKYSISCLPFFVNVSVS